MNLLLTLVVAAAIQGWASGPTGAMTLTQVDGGPNYYAKFSNGLPADKSFFPIGVWFESVVSQRDIDLDKSAGLNTYVVLTGNSNLDLIHSNGMYALLQGDNNDWKPATGKPFNGWLLGDEVDMDQGSGGCPTAINSVKSGLPQDGRLRYANYGKGVTVWAVHGYNGHNDTTSACFVNAQDVTSADLYWFTDPYETNSPQSGQAWGYGWTVDRVRAMDAEDGKRQPIWSFVEVGHPFTNGGQITPDEIRAAVWQSIIAGARGIIYFNHSIGGPSPSQHVLRDALLPNSPYAANRAMVTSVNAQVTALAPVLNSPTVSSGWSQGPGTTAMVKWVTEKTGCRSKAKKRKCKKAAKKHCKSNRTKKKKCRKAQGQLYVFAGSAGSTVEGRFSLPCIGKGTATVVGEGRSIAVKSGSFRDQFANGNAIHIYRIDAGSRCGLPRAGR
jgi:hypothetical protein